MAIHNRRKGLTKIVPKKKKSHVEYIGEKDKNSIKYARVDCYKNVGDELLLDISRYMVVTEFNLSMLKYDVVKVNILIEWDRQNGLIWKDAAIQVR